MLHLVVRKIVPHRRLNQIGFGTVGHPKHVQHVDIPRIDGGDILEVAGEAARLLGGVAYPVETRVTHGGNRCENVIVVASHTLSFT